MDKNLNYWNILDDVTTSEFEDEKSLLATVGIMVRELAIKCPNDQELGKQIRKIINNHNLNTNTNG